MEKQELTETILSSNLNNTSLPNNNYLIAKNKQGEGIYLIWNNKDEKIESKVTEEIYHQCAIERKKHDLEPVYHIYARTINYQSTTITFHKIPDKVLIDFGVDPDTDTFINQEE
jgi:hypothetical protein